MAKEIWKPALGWQGYEVSSSGRIRSHRQNRAHILKQALHRDGYLQVKLYAGSSKLKRTMYVHKLVMEAFRGTPRDDQEVNHKNGDKSDNRLENLEYVTPTENIRHAVRAGLTVAPKGEKCLVSKLTTKDVLKIRGLAKSHSQNQLARMFNISQHGIWAILHRRTWKHI